MSAEAVRSEFTDSPLSFVSSGVTDPGLRREVNEDGLLESQDEDRRLFVVADGVGGPEKGVEATRIALESVKRGFSGKDGFTVDSVRDVLQKANREIFERTLGEPMLAGMGTSLALLFVTSDEAFIAHVGNCRVYRIRANASEVLTVDHTLVEELRRAGAIRTPQRENKTAAHILTRCLGKAPQVEVDCSPIPDGIQEGDIIFLCTDGFYDLVGEDEFVSILSSQDDIAMRVDKLKELALQRGAPDNLTLLAVLASGEGESSRERPSSGKENRSESVFVPTDGRRPEESVRSRMEELEEEQEEEERESPSSATDDYDSFFEEWKQQVARRAPPPRKSDFVARVLVSIVVGIVGGSTIALIFFRKPANVQEVAKLSPPATESILMEEKAPVLLAPFSEKKKLDTLPAEELEEVIKITEELGAGKRAIEEGKRGTKIDLASRAPDLQKIVDPDLRAMLQDVFQALQSGAEITDRRLVTLAVKNEQLSSHLEKLLQRIHNLEKQPVDITHESPQTAR
jgi:PPM family protein phosphatase